MGIPDTVRSVANEKIRKRSGGDEVDWLTPVPDGTEIELAWPEADGPFTLTCHLAYVDGRAQLVGLDIRSFSGDGSPGGRGLSEVNHPALRSLRAGEIVDAARTKLAAELAAFSRSRRGTADQRQEAARRYELLTSPSLPRPTGHRPASDQLQRVAEFYKEALANGGEMAGKPAIYVHAKLTEAGSDVTLNTVRGQIFRAQQKGLIPKIRG